MRYSRLILNTIIMYISNYYIIVRLIAIANSKWLIYYILTPWYIYIFVFSHVIGLCSVTMICRTCYVLRNSTSHLFSLKRLFIFFTQTLSALSLLPLSLYIYIYISIPRVLMQYVTDSQPLILTTLQHIHVDLSF